MSDAERLQRQLAAEQHKKQQIALKKDQPRIEACRVVAVEFVRQARATFGSTADPFLPTAEEIVRLISPNTSGYSCGPSPEGLVDQLWKRFAAPTAMEGFGIKIGFKGPSIQEAMANLQARSRGGFVPKKDDHWSANHEPTALTLGYRQAGPVQLPVVQPEKIRWEHTYVVGTIGSGKTTLLRQLILEDIIAGRGVCVLARELQLLRDEILPFIPAHRWDDVVYVNPLDTEKPVTLNPLQIFPTESLEMRAGEVADVIIRTSGEEDAATARQMQRILRNAIRTLMYVGGKTLLDLTPLLERTPEAEARRLQYTQQIPDLQLRSFWLVDYKGMRDNAHQSVLNRIDQFLSPQLRGVLCGAGTRLDLRDAMDTRKIVLFNLSDTDLSPTVAGTLGTLVITLIQLAAMSRGNIPEDQRVPFYVYVDEFQTFVSEAATSYEEIFTRCRKQRVGLILAHQIHRLLPDRLALAIRSIAGTHIILRPGPEDAEVLKRRMLIRDDEGDLTHLHATRLQDLEDHTAWCHMRRATFFLPLYGLAGLQRFPAVPEASAEVIRRSRARYGAQPAHLESSAVQSPAAALPPGQAQARHAIEEIDPGSAL